MQRSDLLDALVAIGVPKELADHLPEMLPDVHGLLLYGSQARGDAVPGSDLDLLAVVEQGRASLYTGDLSLSFYTAEQLESGRGSLFGAHLKRDAKILWDPTGALIALVANMGEVDTDRLFARASNMARVLTCLERDLPKYLRGLLREARYLLRSSLYAQAIADGRPCFSVREIAQRNVDPTLSSLLASRQAAEPSTADLENCITRLEAILGPLPQNPHGSLEALLVNEWETGGDLVSMAFMALGATGGDADYAEVDKILL